MKHFDNDRPRFASYGFSCETWEPQAMARADQHDEVELNYLLEGTLTYLMGGRRVSVPAQRLVVFWAVVPHQIVEFESESPYYVVTIPFAWFLKWSVPSRLRTQILHCEMVTELVPREPARERLMFEQWMRDVEDESLAAAAALEIQARLLRMASDFTDAPSFAEIGRPIQYESQDKAEQMACHISSSYEERLTIPQIAARVDLHPDYAATLFKKTFGTTIVNFITRHRIAHAQRLLLSTDDQIISVAADSGFDSLSRFNRAFKQMTGLTPREYRRTRR
ncbi:MAG: helix-turn-helix domain-containing protein [Pirellulaceae bacterium]